MKPPLGSRAVRIGQWMAGLAIVGFVIRYLVRNWDEVRAVPIAWQLDPVLLAVGVVAVILVFGLLAGAWRSFLTGWGYRLPPWTAARIWLLSSMAKYLPGKVWALAGMAVMAKQHGVPAWVATGSSLILQVVSIGTGAFVVAAGGSRMLEGADGITLGMVVSAAALSAIVVVVVLYRPLLHRVLGRFGLSTEASPSPRRTAVATLANLLAWGGYGVAFWLFARGTMPDVPLTLGEAVTGNTAAYVAGALAPFAPAGLGVREGVLVLVLQDRTGLGPALALAAVARIGMTIAEIVASVPFLLTRSAPR